MLVFDLRVGVDGGLKAKNAGGQRQSRGFD